MRISGFQEIGPPCSRTDSWKSAKSAILVPPTILLLKYNLSETPGARVYIGVSKVSPPKTTQLEERHLGVFYPDHGRGTTCKPATPKASQASRP